ALVLVLILILVPALVLVRLVMMNDVEMSWFVTNRAGGMAKRIADKELTDRNWDQEEEGEEAGTFSVASEDVLKNRAIKKAKRRNVGAEGESGGAFKGFKGFSLTTAAAAAAAAGSGSSAPTLFSGFGNGGGFKGLGGLTNGNSLAPAFGGFSSPAASTAPGLTFNGPASTADITTKQTNGSAPSPAQSSGSGSSSSSSSSNKEYSRQLTALNCSVRDWITKHVNDNPLCDLNPIFRDYERHLSSIERQYGAAAAPADGGSEEKKQGGMLPTAATPPAPAASSSSRQRRLSCSGCHFVLLWLQNLRPQLLLLLLRRLLQSDLPVRSSWFCSSVLQRDQERGRSACRCKMFYKKDSEFKEKGVGTLHLKQTPEGKTQMIIRADTNLGNILLNIMVQSSMPCSRVGKSNVMVVCVPNPSIDDKNPTKPVPLLIRVKTAEDADELHKILEEKKG
ncbi:hypothetical protein INR49_007898, partial [Caranx melampygus]